MIISKSNLQVLLVTKNDKIPVLNNIHIRQDGTTVGSNGKTILAVSPVSMEARATLKDRIGDDALLVEGVTVAEETAKDVLKNIPKDIQFKGLLEHCNVKVDAESERGVEFTMTDGKRPKVIKGKRWVRDYIQFEEVFARVAKTRKAVQVVLNRRRLMSLLEAVDKACPDSSGNSAVYLEFSSENDIVVRSVNYTNGQRVMGVMQSYKGTEGQWLDDTEWEKSLSRSVHSVKEKVCSVKENVRSIKVPKVACKIPKAKQVSDGKGDGAGGYWEAEKNI
jgi:hypothetical protein